MDLDSMELLELVRLKTRIDFELFLRTWWVWLILVVVSLFFFWISDR